MAKRQLTPEEHAERQRIIAEIGHQFHQALKERRAQPRPVPNEKGELPGLEGTGRTSYYVKGENGLWYLDTGTLKKDPRFIGDLYDPSEDEMDEEEGE